MVMGDESTTDSVRNQADNEFRIRYNGGIRLRVSTAANGNTPARRQRGLRPHRRRPQLDLRVEPHAEGELPHGRR
jgi:hypothetical protein